MIKRNNQQVNDVSSTSTSNDSKLLAAFYFYSKFPSITGFALGSVEGRVAIQYVNPLNPKDNFTFKCHRTNGAPGGYQEIYAVRFFPSLYLSLPMYHQISLQSIFFQVNDIAFHPVHGTLATVGSDGTFSFWDKDARTKLKPSEVMEQSIVKCAFSHNGQIFAYAVGYDWSKVCETY